MGPVNSDENLQKDDERPETPEELSRRLGLVFDLLFDDPSAKRPKVESERNRRKKRETR